MTSLECPGAMRWGLVDCRADCRTSLRSPPKPCTFCSHYPGGLELGASMLIVAHTSLYGAVHARHFDSLPMHARLRAPAGAVAACVALPFFSSPKPTFVAVRHGWVLVISQGVKSLAIPFGPLEACHLQRRTFQVIFAFLGKVTLLGTAIPRASCIERRQFF